MSDDTNEQTTDDGGESPNVKRMREQMEALQEEKNALMARVKLSAFKEAGLDPEKGIGKAVYRTYEGEVDPEQIRQFAEQEYDWSPQSNARLPEGQQRMTALSQVGSPEEAQTRMQQAREAEQQGDWITSAALKDAELLAIAEKRQGYA